MTRRRRRHALPRARWFLMALVLGVFVATLLFQGFLHNEIGHASTADSGGVDVAAQLHLDGPILRLDGAGLHASAPPKKTVALTFDDGPDAHWTPRLLDVLQRERVPATFFVVGSRVASHPELVRAERRAGDDLGVHTFTHVNLSRVPAWEAGAQLALTKAAIAGAADVETTLLRPPYSSTPAAITDRDVRAWLSAARRGYTIVVASLDSNDWQPHLSVDRIVQNATPQDGRGAVVLFHDGGGNRARTVTAVSRLIPTLRAKGYRFVTVRQLLGTATVRPATGSDRVRGDLLLLMSRAGADTTRVFTWLVIAVLLLALVRVIVLVALARLHHRRAGRAFIRSLLSPEPDVAVVVPAYNEEVGIAATITSLAGAHYGGAVEIVVVDDGSTDDTVAVAERTVRERGLRGVRIIRQANGGKASALNTGVRATTAPIVVMVDGDTILAPDAIRELVVPFVDPSIGAVSGNTKIGNRRSILGQWQHIEYVIGFNLERRAYDVLGCMPTVPGAIGAFRRSALEQVGRVSDATLAEDTDLTMHIHRGGWRVVYRPTAVAYTEAPSSLRALWRQRLRWSYGTMQAMWKHRAGFTDPTHEGRRFARLGLTYMTLYQVALPATAPLLDAATIYGILFFTPWLVIAYWIGFNLVQMALGWYAFRLDDERPHSLLLVPLQQFVWRQLMYLVIWDSLLNAAAGTRLSWQKAPRFGQTTVVVDA